MKCSYKVILSVAALVVVFSPAQALDSASLGNAKKVTGSKYSLGRKPTSMGQGLVMFENTKEPYPSFLNPIPKSGGRSPFKITGVCRDAYGVSYNSTDPGFAECLSQSSGQHVNDSLGPINRQSGIGIRIK